MRRLAFVALALILTAGCSDAPPGAGSTSSTVPAATTSPPTNPTTTSTAPPASTSSTSTPSSSTIVTTIDAPDSPFRGDGTLRSLPPATYFPAAAVGAAADVDWAAVGPDWILALIIHEQEYRPALILIDPSDRAFLLGGWDWEGGARLQDWSPDGTRIAYTDAWLSPHTIIIDLLGGLEGEITTDYEADTVRFTRPTGRDVVVGRIYEPDGARISVFRTDGSMWADLVGPVQSADEYSPKRLAWLYHPDGMQVVVSDGDSVRLLSNRGEPIRRLPVDGLYCDVVRWWKADEALVSCLDPTYAATEIASCWPDTGRELWAVPIDGSAPRPVGPETGPGGGCDEPGAYESGRVDAVALGSTLIIETAGCCECGGDLEVWLPDEMLMPGLVECSPWLVGIRSGKALVHVVLRDYNVSGIAEVAAGGSARIVAPGLWEEAWAEFVALTDDPPGSG